MNNVVLNYVEDCINFNITPPVSILHMFNGCLNGINKERTSDWSICLMLGNLVK
jgi:hypothetical protein